MKDIMQSNKSVSQNVNTAHSNDQSTNRQVLVIWKVPEDNQSNTVNIQNVSW